MKDLVLKNRIIMGIKINYNLFNTLFNILTNNINK